MRRQGNDPTPSNRHSAEGRGKSPSEVGALVTKDRLAAMKEAVGFGLFEVTPGLFQALLPRRRSLAQWPDI